MAGKRQVTAILQAGNAPTSAEIEALYTRIHDMLTTVCGLVQTSDTGQLASFSGLSAPVGNVVTIHGYRVYRMNDALSATKPVYLNVLFRYLADTTYCIPWPAFTFGFGTDGAGNLTAPSCSARAISGLRNESTYFPQAKNVSKGKSSNSLACGGEGFFWLALHVDGITHEPAEPAVTAASPPAPYGFRPVAGDGIPLVFICVMRNVNKDGVFLGTGISIVTQSNSMLHSQLEIRSQGALLGILDSSGYRSERTFLGAAAPRVAASRGGIAALSRVMTPAPSDSLEPLIPTHVIGAAPVTAGLASGDVLSGIQLGGGLPRTYIYPSRCLAPLECTPPNERAAYAPLLLWEGADV